ncbi:MAG TPA: alpha/beta hydrolase, partial [Candidatus Saccharimonadales bacterium]|nr:alpha/beta hydrolase [Candidatus Saccharimonadales bacterium]
LKTTDNPSGVDKSVFDDNQQAITKDRYVYLTDFTNNFFNADENVGKSVSEEVLRAHWDVAAAASPIATYACIPTWLTDFRPDVAKLNVPILVIHGDADRILPYDSTAKLLPDRIADCKLVTIAGGSHGILWTHADVINKELLKFLAR